MNKFWSKTKDFLRGLFGFVSVAAPVAETVGMATGNPEVVAAAKLAEVGAAVGTATIAANDKLKDENSK